MDGLQVFELSLVVQSVRIFGFHPEDPGSIPGRGAIFDLLVFLGINALQRLGA